MSDITNKNTNKIQSKPATFLEKVNEFWFIASYLTAIGIAIRYFINLHGASKGYEKLGRYHVIPPTDILHIVQLMGTIMLLVGLGFLCACSIVLIVYVVRNKLKPKLNHE